VDHQVQQLLGLGLKTQGLFIYVGSHGFLS
jgi:hypothetical protein